MKWRVRSQPRTVPGTEQEASNEHLYELVALVVTHMDCCDTDNEFKKSTG